MKHLCRLLPPKWLNLPVLEGRFTQEQLIEFNSQGYGIHHRPNYPSVYEEGTNVKGDQIDTFEYVFVDFDLKSKTYPTNDAFIAELGALNLTPTKIVDSGHGCHAYWRVTDLDAMSYLRLQRRLIRRLKTDEALCQIAQLIRMPDTVNTKFKDDFVPCETILDTGASFTCEEIDSVLPAISKADESWCQDQYNRAYNKTNTLITVDDALPSKFGALLRSSKEVKELWSGEALDRSKNDYRLGHLLFANGFTKDEARSVLVNSAKALDRAPVHRLSYANNIIDKIYTYEESGDLSTLSPTVRDILSRGEDTLTGTRFPCHRLIDDTVHGFRLGQVLGIIAGSKVGKTTVTLNAFLWFAELNPDYHHCFFSLEQPAGEIASRIRNICQGNETLYDRIHIVSNYREDGTFINFSMDMIEEHILALEKEYKCKLGAVVIDHIGVIHKSNKHGENEGLIEVCRKMKSVAIRTSVMLIMLSQSPREKAGIGDIELDKSAAYGTVFFEAFCDFCICLWQPLKRAYHLGAPTSMAFKFAAIRHKKQNEDRIKEDIAYRLYFDPNTERLREMSQDETKSFDYFLGQAITLRKADKKTDILSYTSRLVVNET